jgi:hypothetical protein
MSDQTSPTAQVAAATQTLNQLHTLLTQCMGLLTEDGKIDSGSWTDGVNAFLFPTQTYDLNQAVADGRRTIASLEGGLLSKVMDGDAGAWQNWQQIAQVCGSELAGALGDVSKFTLTQAATYTVTETGKQIETGATDAYKTATSPTTLILLALAAFVLIVVLHYVG